MHLNQLGWDHFFAQSFEVHSQRGYIAGRVAIVHKDRWVILTEQGEHLAEIAGRFRHQIASAEALPVVGDWVALRLREGGEHGIIGAVLPRKSKFSRKGVGSSNEEQLVATNIDTAFLVSGLDGDFNPRRIERYMVLAWESGANPVIVLSKADLCSDVAHCLRAVESIAAGLPIVVLSANEDQGLLALQKYLKPGQTAALLGSSGVGKSTIVNRLMGRQIQRTAEVRADDSRGRHTTTHRELIALESGGLLIDTPGMREIQLWATDDSLQSTFSDVETVAQHCRFRDCHHLDEPDCAVKQAIETGALSPARFASYQKLQKELDYLIRKQDPLAQQAQKQQWKKIHKQMRSQKP
ncbi:MAG: ribosome small subunit-dependent GTPase A [Anaerolineae bacterium]|nr:ribosome small subunit-dependent GTPase A [Gloeobacterales cyanobacterium ES-bin-313]